MQSVITPTRLAAALLMVAGAVALACHGAEPTDEAAAEKAAPKKGDANVVHIEYCGA